jgi:hypothetical protein
MLAHKFVSWVHNCQHQVATKKKKRSQFIWKGRLVKLMKCSFLTFSAIWSKHDEDKWLITNIYIYVCVCVCKLTCNNVYWTMQKINEFPLNSQHIQISKRCPSPVTQIQRAFMKAWPKTKFFKTVPITNMHSFSKPRNWLILDIYVNFSLLCNAG